MVLWDFETRGVAKELQGGHAGEVTALSWAHNGRTLATVDADALLLWDVLSANVLRRVKLPGAGVRSSLVYTRVLPQPMYSARARARGRRMAAM